MAARRLVKCTATGQLHRLWGPAILLALLAGCAQPQKSDAARPGSPQAAKKAPSDQTPTPAVAPGRPTPSATRRQAAPTPAPDKPAPPTPLDRKSATGKAPDRGVERPAAPAQPAAAAQPGVDELAKKEGCGAPDDQKTELTPPPPDQPQPKFVCAQTKVIAEPVWQGKTAEFSFAIRNEGQAPLAIRVKPT
jgi:hypothetical protein